MRTIELFKIKPSYVLGDSENLNALSTKLPEDERLFSQIESDFKSNKEKYKEEFFLAKKNLLTNKYAFNWLVLKKYFEDALPSERFSLFPDFQKEEMKKKGWMLPHAFINWHLQASGSFKTEDLYIDTISEMFDSLFCFNIGQENSRIDRYYKQAISCYKNSYYYSCAVSLFPIIESCHQALTRFKENDFYKIKKHLDEVKTAIDGVQQIYEKKILHYSNLVKQFNDLAENHYFNVSLDRDNEPEIINRNRLMHGIFSREVSKKDCLQLFCCVSNMIVIKHIIDANEQLNEISKELEKMKDLKDNN